MAKSTNGAFTVISDVGTTGITGRTKYDESTQIYTVTGGGENIWGRSDEFHFAALSMSGDFMITASGEFLGEGVNAHRKWGVMLRASLDGASAYADAAVHGDGLTSLQYREESGADTKEVKAALTAPETVQIERLGDTIIMRAANAGEPLVETGRITLRLPGGVLAGIFVCSHDRGIAETAAIRNVRIDITAEGYAGKESPPPSPSRIEILDVDTGLRRIIYATTDHVEAPNWSRDGKFLLFNQEGRIYRFNFDGMKTELVDTGDVRANNNDHGLSFDGTLLALSSFTEQPGRKRGSQIYLVPVAGGTPVKVTDEAPSYWHGWSPDGNTLAFCGERNGNYDVWTISVKGGPETRLTTDPGLDDGPEYSPDGNYIYFNSTRSGQMKIWRMRPDGSNQEQVSFGDCNDWFAHLSPDGARMVYVSYPTSVSAADHPRNKRVMIREQIVATGKVRVLAHLYGGQGTMNVPSWSPDGKAVAFVSYTYGNPEV